MLQAMKTQAAKWVIRLLAVLLIISFAAWGVGDMITGRGLPTDVAEVGDAVVTAQEFRESFREQVERLREALGPDVDSEQARRFGLAETTLENLVSRRLLRLYADDSGILVGDDQIRQHIRAEPAFRGLAGEFDRAAFQNALYRLGMNEQRYVEDLRERIGLGHLTGVVAQAAAVPDSLADLLFHYHNDRRVARYVAVAYPRLDDVPAPDESELAEFHRANPSAFTAPERRDLAVLHLDPERTAREIQPSEEELRAEYDSRLSELTIPEKRELSQIVVGVEDKAHEAVRALQSGRPMKEVAETVADMQADTVKLGTVTREDLPVELAEAAFALPVNAPSAPVQSPLGWHVLLVEKIEPGRVPGFSEVREEIQADLAGEQAVDALVKIANRLEDSLAGGAGLEEAAAELDTPLLRIPGVEADGGTRDGDAPAELLEDPRFVAAAFETPPGRTGELTETADGGYFILRVDRAAPAALEPFDKIREKVAAAWRRDKRAEAARLRAEKLLAELRGGRSLDAAAEEAGLAVASTSPFTRFDQGEDPGLPGELVAELFRLKPGEAAAAAGASAHIVAVLHEIRPAAPDAADIGFDDLRARLKASMAADLTEQYTRSLRRIYPVRIDTAALDRLFDERIVGP